MQLYYAPKTRAVRPRFLLEELGVAYELLWIKSMGLLEGHPALAAYASRIEARPAAYQCAQS